jgi:hypothetical protein
MESYVSFPLPNMFHRHLLRSGLFFPTQIRQDRGFRHRQKADSLFWGNKIILDKCVSILILSLHAYFYSIDSPLFMQSNSCLLVTFSLLPLLPSVETHMWLCALQTHKVRGGTNKLFAKIIIFLKQYQFIITTVWEGWSFSRVTIT